MKNTTVTAFISLLFLGACSRNEYVPPVQNYLENLRQQNVMPQPQIMQTPYVVQAQVISATPIFKEAPDRRQECRIVEVPVSYEGYAHEEQGRTNDDSGHPVAGAFIGGVAGALVGNRIGNGEGREFARVAGTAAGALAGYQLGRAPAKAAPAMQTMQRTRYERQERCEEVVSTRQEISGYTVIYTYQGQQMTTTMPNDPGPYVSLVVAR